MYFRVMRLCIDLKKKNGFYAFKTNYIYITGWLQCRIHITWNRTYMLLKSCCLSVVSFPIYFILSNKNFTNYRCVLIDHCKRGSPPSKGGGEKNGSDFYLLHGVGLSKIFIILFIIYISEFYKLAFLTALKILRYMLY